MNPVLPSHMGREWVLAALAECRSRTLTLVEGAAERGDVDVDRIHPGAPNSVGTLLYHIAAIEVDWVFADLLGVPFPPEAYELFPYDVREDGSRLTPVLGHGLDMHLRRLSDARAMISSAIAAVDDAALVGPVVFADGRSGTGSWIVHHLLQHEAEHRGQLGDVLATVD